MGASNAENYDEMKEYLHVHTLWTSAAKDRHVFLHSDTDSHQPGRGILEANKNIQLYS